MKIKHIKDEKIRALAYLRYIEDNGEADIESYLNEFYWDNSPEKRAFWSKVIDGLDPYAKDELTEQLTEELPEPVKNFTDLTKYPIGTKVKNGLGQFGRIEPRHKWDVANDIIRFPVCAVFEGKASSFTNIGVWRYNREATTKDIVEIVVDEIDLSTCKEGDRLLCRDGRVFKYLEKIGTRQHMVIDLSGETWICHTPLRLKEGSSNPLDIIQILPSEESVEEPAQEAKPRRLYCTLTLKARSARPFVYEMPINSDPYTDESGFLVILPDKENRGVIRIAISEVESYQTWEE